jgi:hypothetical protein
MGTSDRRPYLSTTVLNQSVLDLSQDSLVQKLEMIADIETPTGTLHLSDRAKYVGTTFYENRVNFPGIERTVGEWLSGTLQFSTLEIVIANPDKKFSNLLPGGADYNGFINREVEIKIGLAEIASSYITVFQGFVTDVEGFSRGFLSFTLICRNKFDSVNKAIPNQSLIADDFPQIEDEFIGLAVPLIYGDWTTALRREGSMVPAFPVNGIDPLVNNSLDPVDPNVGDTALRLVISSTPLLSLDTTTVTLLRGDAYYIFASSDISILGGTDNTVFDITQKNLLIDGTPWIYESGDEFFVRCQGTDITGTDSNIVDQAKDIMIRFGGIASGDFDSTWTTFAAKASPAESAISTILSRVWVQEANKVIDLAASMLEQVRLEPFINRDNQWSLASLHFDEIETNPTFKIRNWDVAKGSMQLNSSERNNFNRAKADYSFDPAKGENSRSTPTFRNQAAITQANNREISKLITFPQLYVASDVETQLKEILRLASGYTEFVDLVLTPRAFLKDIGEYVQLSIDIGSIEFSETSSPIVGMIRDLSYIPGTMGIGARIWMYQMINFPGYTGPAGTVGGYDKTITQEV